ncbi:MAG TPA: SDR family oxidoreductase [Candidatus Limnocylindria bacterium]|jgi:NAD(P)-dependent dehydrogenase (short-subunit alcohol dehydrogenase family)|nr:SDR family oxidoreductase [Candidatus Limnocylindria bacterium]
MPVEHAPSPELALITGGSRGIGRAIVLSLAERGVDTIFTYHARRDEADRVVELVAAAGRRAVALQLDVADAGSFAAFAARVRDALAALGAERLTALVNNAGTSHHNAIERTTAAELDALYAVHFKAPFLLTQALLPLLADGGRIVNISSGLTRLAYPGSAAYASMKGALEVLTRYLAKELGPRGIVVNTVAPGAIQTDFSGGIVRDDPAVNAQIAAVTALGRAGVVEDVGPFVAALLSGAGRWVNGQRIEVSGGLVL